MMQSILVMVGFCLVWTGCSPAVRTDPARALQPPQRILSLSTAATHILLQLDRPPAAIDEFGRLAVGDRPLPVIGKGTTISREKLAELHIDCVLLWYYQSSAAGDFRSAGIRVEVIPQLRLQNYPALLLQLGRLTDRTAAALALRAAFLEQLQAVQAVTAENPVRVCFELYAPGKIAGDQSYPGDLLRAAGGRSINPGRSGLLSPERIIEAAPQIIFFVEGYADIAELSTRNAYSATPAAQAQRILAFPRQLLIEGLAPIEAIAFLREKIATLQH